jgi:hypothetical protein
MTSDWKEQLREIARQGLVKRLASERLKEIYCGINKHQPLQPKAIGDREHSSDSDAGETRGICSPGISTRSPWSRNNDPFVVEHSNRVQRNDANRMG